MKRSLPMFLAILVVAAFVAFETPAEAQPGPHECSYCHSLHGSTGSIPLTNFSQDFDLCMSCHDAGAPPVFDGKVVPKDVAVHEGDKHTPGDVTSCIACHDHYGETQGNLKLIPRLLDSRYTGSQTVVFTAQSGPNSFADGDTTYDGVCEVCHTVPEFHRNNPSGDHTHEAAATCTQCHTHTNKFQGSCTESGCHDPGGTYDPLTTGGAGSAGKHVTHVFNKGQNCSTCHDSYLSAASHRDGTVNGKNDEISPVSFNTLNPAGVYTDLSQSSGTGTCAGTSCHSTETPDWYDPAPTLNWPSVCADCHSPGSVIDPMTIAGSGTAGKHTKHVTDRSIGCDQCHSQYVAAPQDAALHMDGRLDTAASSSLVAFLAGENPSGFWRNDAGAQQGSCGGTYCHGATDGVTTVVNTPDWYEVVVPTWTAGTAYALGTVVAPTAGNGFYYKVMTAGTSVAAEPAWPTTFKSRVTDGTVEWRRQTATSGLPCEACHSAGSFTDPLTINSTGLAGQHVKHVNDREYECTMCHDGYDQNANHVNFAFDTGVASVVSYDAANPYAGWNVGAGSCADTYCHGATLDNLYNTNNTPSWYFTVPAGGLACEDCHSSNSFLDPQYRDGCAGGCNPPVVNDPNEGWHATHIGNSAPCLACHDTYNQQATHGNLNEILLGTAEARIRSDLVPFAPEVSADPAAPDTFFTGDTGQAGEGGCGGSLCHYPGAAFDHTGEFNMGGGTWATWYNN